MVDTYLVVMGSVLVLGFVVLCLSGGITISIGNINIGNKHSDNKKDDTAQ